MSTSNMTTDGILSDLLADEAWARGLARALVGESRGDDLLQASLLKAIQSPPRRPGPLRAWFATVMRNTASSQARADGRRAAREQRAARSEELDETPVDFRARIEQRRVLAEQLLALPESLRTTLVLRFEEDLSAAEISRRLKVPESTVRLRLKRGLERLREQLDGVHNGEREAWMRALAPLASLADPGAARVGLSLASVGAAALLVTAAAMPALVLMTDVEERVMQSGARIAASLVRSFAPLGPVPATVIGGAAEADAGEVAEGRLRVHLSTSGGRAADAAGSAPVRVRGLLGSELAWERSLRVEVGGFAELDLPRGYLTQLELQCEGAGEFVGAQRSYRSFASGLPASVRLTLLEPRPVGGRVVDLDGRPVGAGEAEVRMWPDRGFERVRVDGAGRFEATGRVDRGLGAHRVERLEGSDDELELSGYVLLAHSEGTRTRAELEAEAAGIRALAARGVSVAEVERQLAALERSAAPVGELEQLFVVAPEATVHVRLDSELAQGHRLALRPADRAQLAPEFDARLGLDFGALRRAYSGSLLLPDPDADSTFVARPPAGLALQLAWSRGVGLGEDRIHAALGPRGTWTAELGPESAALVLAPGEVRRTSLSLPGADEVFGALFSAEDGRPPVAFERLGPVRLQYEETFAGGVRPVSDQVHVRDGAWRASLPGLRAGSRVSAWIETWTPDGAILLGSASGLYAGEPLQLDLSFEGDLAIAGRLEYAGRGTRFATFQVAAVPVDGDLNLSCSVGVAEDGSFRLPVLAPGRYRLLGASVHPYFPGSILLGEVQAPVSDLAFAVPDWQHRALSVRVSAPDGGLSGLEAWWRPSPWCGPDGVVLEPSVGDLAASLRDVPVELPSARQAFAWRSVQGLEELFAGGPGVTELELPDVDAGPGRIDLLLHPRFVEPGLARPVLLTGIGGPEPEPIALELEPLVALELIAGPAFTAAQRVDVVSAGGLERALRDAQGRTLEGAIPGAELSSRQLHVPASAGRLEVVALDGEGSELQRVPLELSGRSPERVFLP